jgi:hypothetical protein
MMNKFILALTVVGTAVQAASNFDSFSAAASSIN